jgi:crossover junction endodeoxyribonuclease RuvC
MFDSVVLGLDPGLTRCGWGVVARTDGVTHSRADGTISTPKDLDVGVRLARLFDAIEDVVSLHDLDSVAIEQVLFGRNVRTGIATAQASGVALLCFARHGLAVTSYTPTQVKSAVTGWGGADKDQVRMAVARLLGIDRPPSADAADALGLALCHLTAGRTTATVGAAGRGQADPGSRYRAAVDAALERDGGAR